MHPGLKGGHVRSVGGRGERERRKRRGGGRREEERGEGGKKERKGGNNSSRLSFWKSISQRTSSLWPISS